MPSMPLHVTSPKDLSRAERLAAVRATMSEMKTSYAGMITKALTKVLVSFGLDSLIGDTNIKVFKKHSFVYSNVPGFEEEVKLFGEVGVRSFASYCEF